jgi:2-phosphosulfolactate phosphatase
VAIGVIVSARLPSNVLLVHVHVAFTPGEAAPVPTGIVVDVLRATSSVVQALDSGYQAVFCCSEIEDALDLKDELKDAVLAGERGSGAIPGFELGNSPREFLVPSASTLVLTTTNGTRALVTAAADCDVVLAGSLLNLEAVAEAAAKRGEDVEVVCAGVGGEFTPDDAYCAGRIVELLGGERTEAAQEAVRLAHSFANAEDAFRQARAVGETISEEDLRWCARESVTAVVPRLTGMRGPAAELRPS